MEKCKGNTHTYVHIHTKSHRDFITVLGNTFKVIQVESPLIVTPTPVLFWVYNMKAGIYVYYLNTESTKP